MAKRVEGMTEKLQEQAMQEFCQHGYMGASMRTISENAGTTPRSIYTRYGDKEGLFSALVSNCADSLKGLIGDYMEGYAVRPVAEQRMLLSCLSAKAKVLNMPGLLMRLSASMRSTL